MTRCPRLDGNGSEGVSAALRVIDCESAQAVAAGFGRLFGPSGALGAALTILLTLYVALLAINLLTGRSRLGLNAFTPRMLGLGLVLTFATSWIAYQSVVWTLLTGAPDQIASILMGQSGSATSSFANRLDAVFGAVAEAARQASQPLPPTATGITPAPAQAGGWTAADVLWLGSLLLLLGTVGVLLVARIALAALLAVGPIFIVFALFSGTHGLFVGWLKGAVMMALVPLFTVLLGSTALALLAPIVNSLAVGPVTMQAAVTLFVGASVHVALMVMVLKVSGAIVSGWSLSRDKTPAHVSARPMSTTGPQAGTAGAVSQSSPMQVSSRTAADRVRPLLAGPRAVAEVGESAGTDHRTHALTPRAASHSTSLYLPSATGPDRRSQGVGARFRTSFVSPASAGKWKNDLRQA